MAKNETVNASPTKRFFIAVLIKDISFLNAIVELVDNSVDSARAQSGVKDIGSTEIEIRYSKRQFSIKTTQQVSQSAKLKTTCFVLADPRMLLRHQVALGSSELA